MSSDFVTASDGPVVYYTKDNDLKDVIQIFPKWQLGMFCEWIEEIHAKMEPILIAAIPEKVAGIERAREIYRISTSRPDPATDMQEEYSSPAGILRLMRGSLKLHGVPDGEITADKTRKLLGIDSSVSDADVLKMMVVPTTEAQRVAKVKQIESNRDAIINQIPNFDCKHLALRITGLYRLQDPSQPLPDQVKNNLRNIASAIYSITDGDKKVTLVNPTPADSLQT